MNAIGIIAEYNPLHNGHLHHLNQIRHLEKDALIIAVITTSFTQRGTPSLLDKYTKTKLCLDYGIDLVIELPFPFATQGADIFAKGAIQILSALQVKKIYFGSESNDVEKLTTLAKIALEEEYQERVCAYLKMGENYPTALNKAFLNQGFITTPNDLLGLSYIKEILKQKKTIEPKTIQRTNAFHETEITGSISSATSIRQAIIEKKDFKNTVPEEVYKILKHIENMEEKYYPFLKYKILSSENLSIYQTVDEGIEHRIKKVITESDCLETLIQKIKTKRYTYNRLKRMCCHILCDFTKERAKKFNEVEYIRILGFNSKGQSYLNKIKKQLSLPLITTLSKGQSEMLEYEKQVFSIYSSIFPYEKQIELNHLEYSAFPLQKKEE